VIICNDGLAGEARQVLAENGPELAIAEVAEAAREGAQ
jgi:hypothetical protein